MDNIITKEKIEKYYDITTRALKMAKESANRTKLDKEREDIINMVECYLNDTMFFFKDKEDYINAFAALNYAHGWLDCAARLGIFDVHDSVLFTVDEK
ncbi:DUF357 domain-containing protein [Candidatus Woesearchaeota archaeon]|nr:DUF357 domain-containing protein [Candidatus Woesearchaeota archaeon]